MKAYWKKMINCSVLAGLSCVAITGLNADTPAQESPKKVDIELALEMNAIPPVELRSPFEEQSSKCKVHSTSWNHDASLLAAGVSCKHDHSVNSAHVQLLQMDILVPLFIRLPSDETVRKVKAVFSPDGSLLAVSTNDKAIRFYDVHKGFILKHVHELGDNNYLYPSFAFSPDGTLFAVGDERDINVFSLKSDFLHLGTINNIRPVDIRFISDNNTLAVKSLFDIKVFHSKDSFSSSEVVKSSKLERRRRYHQGFASSPDGSMMAFSSSGSEIKFLDDRACKKEDLDQLVQEKRANPFMVSDKYLPCFGNSFFNQSSVYSGVDYVTSMTFNNDGSLLAVGGTNRKASENIKIFSKNKSGWSLAHSINEPKSTVNSASFSPDGELLAVAGVDGKIWLYEIDPAEDNEDEVDQDEVNLVNKSTTPKSSNLTTEYSMCTIFGHCK
ncbi:WD40 repeat domain-containing protein [Endozoicomonas sp. 2B-B]